MRRIVRSLFFLLFALGLFSVLPLSARPWKTICASGKLRVLTAEAELNPVIRGLVRREMPIHRERALLRGFAAKHHLTIEYVPAENFSQLFHLLESDEGDLISANLAASPGRQAKFLLSVPYAETNEVIFTASSSKVKGSGIEALYGAKGKLLPGTTYEEYFQLFCADQPKIVWQSLPKTISHDELIDKVANGRIDYSVLNECDLDAYLSYSSGIRKIFPLRLHVPLVFAANKKSAELIRQLNLFLEPLSKQEQKQADAAKPADMAKPESQPQNEESFGDLAAIQKRGYIRMLARNEFFGCYLHRGQLCGFEYELAKRFAKSIGVEVVTVIPPDFEDMVKLLKEGKGDFIAANFSRIPERIGAHPSLTFCTPYGSVDEVLVGRPDEKVSQLSDLANRRIFVRKGNSYYQTLLRLQKAGKFIIEPIPENESMISIFQNTASGKYDLTVADETYWHLAASHRFKLKKVLTLSRNNQFSWVVRKKNPQLAAAVDAFFQKEHKSAFFNTCWKRYYVSSSRRAKEAPLAFKPGDLTISPYDKLFQKYGGMYGFEWYFLAAQSYQESRFKTDAVNHVGAAGLMQVTPIAAKEVGIGNLTVPENGIKAGTLYLSKIRKKFDDKIKPEDQLCFTLASYNAGYGHVRDARRLAAQKGWNPDVWFDHTEKALALLEEPRYASRAKFGYCRASETIPYVRNIMLNTHNYRKLIDAKAASRPGGETKK